MNRRFRTLAALAAIVAFLFAQATTAAYACAGPVPDEVAVAQMKAVMGGDGGLCQRHCATGTVSFDLAKPAATPMPSIDAAPVLRVEVVQPVAVAITMPAPRLSIAGPEPPFGRFTVLRI